jgi:hypothetical protein
MTRENRRILRKTCPSAILSTTNPAWIDPSANPGLRGGRPTTNDLSHGTATHCRYSGEQHWPRQPEPKQKSEGNKTRLKSDVFQLRKHYAEMRSVFVCAS